MTPRTLTELRRAVQQATPPAHALLRELEADARKGARALHAQLVRRLAGAEAARARTADMLQFEEAAAAEGFSRVAGVDEAGRGPLAGPIVAAAVVLSGPLAGINDSKQLTYEEREAFYACLVAGGHAIGTAVIAPAEIDRHGIQRANYQAMAMAVRQMAPEPDFLLIDGFAVPGLEQPQRRIVKGDSRSQSIAAASVIAKVTRDRLMMAYDNDYPQYGFAQHKGYGTRAHLEALARHGPCPIHRLSFAPLARPRETGALF